MMLLRGIIFASIGFLLLPQLALAQEDSADIQVRTVRNHVLFRLNEDGTHVETREIATKIVDKRAIEYAKFGFAGWSTSVESGEVLEAYTLKADGRRIDVPKNNYQLDVSKGRDANSPIYSDRTTLTLVFPEVAVDDTMVMKYRIVAKEAIFLGQFSGSEYYQLTQAIDDASVTFDAPESLALRFHVNGLKREEVATGAGDRVISKFRLTNPEPKREKRRNSSVWEIDDTTGVSASTFRSYEQIARAYWLRAAAKAIPTERVKKLAEEIVGEMSKTKAAREQISALHKWVTDNIHYAGNCVGVGAVVPRDVDFVLENRIGDCKDYATLMQALMSARGIKSEQALVNASSAWRLPSVPLVFAVNHVINYVPSLNLFFDATATSLPLGILSPNVAGKPVLLVENYIEGKRTPWETSQRSVVTGKANLKIAKDGSVTGTSEIVASGPAAVNTRQRMRQVTKRWEEETLKNLFNREANGGSGTIEKDDPNIVRDAYRYQYTFNIKEYLNLPGPAAWSISAPGMFEASIGGRLFGLQIDPEETAKEMMCIGGASSEEIVVNFPPNAPLLAVPRDLQLSEGLVSYRASYRRVGNTLRVKRELDDKRVGPVCDLASMRALQPFVKKIRNDLKTQVVYR